MVRILSGMAMPRKATNGTQIRLSSATTTPTLSAPSQFSQPSANSRFCSRVSRLRAGQETPPVLLHDLEAAIGPAVALLLVGVEAVGQQAVAVAPVGVVREPAEFENGQAEIGVLADRVARPVAGGVQRRAADQAHRAVHDDGVLFVPLHHADVEEAGIFAVHGVMHDAARRRRDDPAAPGPGRPWGRRTAGTRSFSQSGCTT